MTDGGVDDATAALVRAISAGHLRTARALGAGHASMAELDLTPLTHAIIFGGVGDVVACLDAGAELEQRDFWSRTPWMLAVLTGDIEMAATLRARGADVGARTRTGRSALHCAAEEGLAHMLEWLITNGADIEEASDAGVTALISAASNSQVDATACLIRLGANVGHACEWGSALANASSLGCIELLLQAGADPSHLNHGSQRLLSGLPYEPSDRTVLATVSPEAHARACCPTFGNSNPEQVDEAHLETMIRAGVGAWEARRQFGQQLPGPEWCAERYGQSLTVLPDGRVVRIGGEHEDSYHSEFCIYNDVWIHEVDGRITFFRYPREDFPPTDFHTATLHRDGIHVIGCLGYRFDRQEGITPVFRLDTVTWRMQRLHCEGDGPGWIHRHRATMIDDGVVLISGGEVYTVKEGRSVLEPVSGRWTLDLVRRTWRRVD